MHSLCIAQRFAKPKVNQMSTKLIDERIKFGMVKSIQRIDIIYYRLSIIVDNSLERMRVLLGWEYPFKSDENYENTHTDTNKKQKKLSFVFVFDQICHTDEYLLFCTCSLIL